MKFLTPRVSAESTGEFSENEFLCKMQKRIYLGNGVR